jgi:hypothetical protein
MASRPQVRGCRVVVFFAGPACNATYCGLSVLAYHGGDGDGGGDASTSCSRIWLDLLLTLLRHRPPLEQRVKLRATEVTSGVTLRLIFLIAAAMLPCCHVAMLPHVAGGNWVHKQHQDDAMLNPKLCHHHVKPLVLNPAGGAWSASCTNTSWYDNGLSAACGFQVQVRLGLRVCGM